MLLKFQGSSSKGIVVILTRIQWSLCGRASAYENSVMGTDMTFRSVPH
jgi:hypothetical protein